MYLRLAVLFVAVFIALGVTLPQQPAAEAMATASSTYHVSLSASSASGGGRGLTADEFEDILDDLVESLEDGVSAIAADPPPLSATTKEAIRQLLLDAEAIIDDIQDPNIAPNLSPANAGQPGSSQSFNTLEACAEQCADWANEALAEIYDIDSNSDSYVGYRLDSILLALSQYRDLADL
jgi:hypothetical protein